MIPEFSDVKPVTDDDIYGAVYDFIVERVKPAIAPGFVIRGWENRYYLPPGTNEFAVMTILYEERRGTNVTKFTPTDTGGTYTEARLSLVDIQIDFCSDTDAARQRANMLVTIARSEIGTSFFKKYGFGCLYADEVRGIETVDGSSQYVKRYMTTLRLDYTTAVSAEVGSFDSVNVKLKNVDTLKEI